jgi:hypothetical protein
MGLPVEQRNQYAWGALGLASRCYAGLWDAAARKTAPNATFVLLDGSKQTTADFRAR